MAPVSTSVPAAVVLKAVRGWRLFPCRTEMDRAVMAVHPSQPADGTGCRWLMPAAEMAGLAGGSWRSPPDPALTGWACPPRIATRALRAEAGSVLAAAGRAGPGPRVPVRLGLLQQGPWVLCAVADPGTAVPVPRTPGSLAEAGRGLQMICAFSDLWGYTTPGEAGKVVWAMFTARHAPPSPARNPGRPGRDPVPGTAR